MNESVSTIKEFKHIFNSRAFGHLININNSTVHYKLNDTHTVHQLVILNTK